MGDTITVVRYSDELERPTHDEAETVSAIIGAMTNESRTVADRDGGTVRASHAKSTGLLKAVLVVPDGLPPALAQGLFATGGRYDAAVRLAQGPGEVLSDSVSTHRGMSIKVFGVPGPKLPGHADATTQDFVLATGPAFPQADAKTFLKAIRGIEKNTGRSETVKTAVSDTFRAANAVLHAVGSDSATAGFFGHTKRSPLADAYFSQAALRWGDHVAKLGAFPASPALLALVDRTLDTGADPDAFRHAVIAFLRDEGAVFELRAQLCTDLARMPVEDASVPWPEDASPYRTVARLEIPAQDAYAPARQRFFDERMSFQPAHSLAAHRPLGSLMRARLATYEALARHRFAETGQSRVEPRGIDEIPD